MIAFKNKVLFLVICLIHLAGAHAADQGVTADGETFKEIYESNLRKSLADVDVNNRRLDFEFAIVLNRVTEAVLANDYFSLDLGSQVTTRPAFRIRFGPQFRSGAWLVVPDFGFSYTYFENNLVAESKSGGRYNDFVRIQWLPLHTGLKLNWSLPGRLSFSQLFARIGANYDWISVAGTLDGISHSYWTPSYTGSLGLSLFGFNSGRDHWFDGVSLSGTRVQGGARGLTTQSVDLGLRFLM